MRRGHLRVQASSPPFWFQRCGKPNRSTLALQVGTASVRLSTPGFLHSRIAGNIIVRVGRWRHSKPFTLQSAALLLQPPPRAFLWNCLQLLLASKFLFEHGLRRIKISEGVFRSLSTALVIPSFGSLLALFFKSPSRRRLNSP